MRLRSAFLLFGILTVLITSSIFTAVSFYEIREVKKESTIFHLRGLAADRGEHLNEFINLQKENINKISNEDIFLGFITKYYKTSNVFEDDKQIILDFLGDFEKNIAVIDDKGKVILSTYRFSDVTSDNISWSTYKIEDDKEFNFYIYYNNLEKKDFLAISKYFNTNDNYTGNIVLDVSLDELEKIMSLDSGSIHSISKERIYLINEDYLLLTPIKFPDKKIRDDLLVQTIYTENSRKCVEDLGEEGHEENYAAPYTDFRGEQVFGTHLALPEANWCILAETDFSDVYDNHLFIKKNIYILIILLILIGTFGYLFSNYLKNSYVRRISLKFRDNKGESCGKCGIFMSNIPLYFYFIFAIIFAVIYFFAVASFFQGWQNAKFFDDLPDLIFFVISFVLFGISFRLKNYFARSNIAIGAVFLCIWKLAEVVLQEYQAVIGILGPEIWFLALINYFIGFSFLFAGFKEEIQ